MGISWSQVLGQYPVDMFCSNRKMYMDDKLLLAMLDKGNAAITNIAVTIVV